MATKTSIERVKENALFAKKTITELKHEINVLNMEYNNVRAQQLREENIKLTLAVEEAKNKLIQLENKNGVAQVQLPNQPILKATLVPEEVKETDVKIIPKSDTSKANKPKKPKEVKEKAPPAAELPIDVGRLDLRAAKVKDVARHPDADSLYVLKIDCGEEKPRTVCSGLVKHVPMEELKDRSVMLLCNLKPVKMRGITSEAMVMCASSPDVIEVLLPPVDAVPGDLVHCEGYTRQPDLIMNPKKKIFETVAPDLHTNENLEACYKGLPFYIPGKGNFVSKSLKNVMQQRAVTEQLRREAAIKRIPVSQAVADIIKYINEHEQEDCLLVGFSNQRINPFREKSPCTLL